MRGRRRLGCVAGSVALLACAPAYRLEAASGGTAERAAVDGFGLTASVNAWPGGSRQLVGQVIPIWIQVENRSGTSARVRYDDFGAVDEHGYWFGLVDPKTGRLIESPMSPVDVAHPGVSPSRQGPAELPSRLVGGPRSDDPGHPSVTMNWDAVVCERADACAEVTLLPTWRDDTTNPELVLAQYRLGAGRRGFSGPPGSSYSYYGYWGGYSAYPFYGYPGYYGYYGWGWPYYDSAYYWPYSYGYGRAARGERLPTTAMMVHVALAEGELKPGAATAGFVYLPSAARRATRLDVTWAVHSTKAQPLTEVAARFLVVADE